MPDLLGLDPARIERLRDPARYQSVDPQRLWEVLEAPQTGTIVDVGAGVGFVTLPFAERFRDVQVIACDVLEGMLNGLAEDAASRGLDNVSTAWMASHSTLPLADDTAELVVMLQVHHELDDAPGLLADCARVLRPGGCIAIVDWKDEELDGVPPAGRRVAAETIMAQLRDAGFAEPSSHALYSHHSAITSVL